MFRAWLRRLNDIDQSDMYINLSDKVVHVTRVGYHRKQKQRINTA